MKQAQIKILFDTGAVSNPVVTRTVLSKKWQLMVDVKDKRGEGRAVNKTHVMESKRGKTREFSTIEAVIKLLKEIGFRDLKVSFY